MFQTTNQMLYECYTNVKHRLNKCHANVVIYYGVLLAY